MVVEGCDVDHGLIFSFDQVLEKAKKQRSSHCWCGWWQHWSPSQQHMGRVHGWEHTNASLHGPCASPWLTKSMGNLKQESCHSQSRVTRRPLQDWELQNSLETTCSVRVHTEALIQCQGVIPKYPKEWFLWSSKWGWRSTLSAGCAVLIDSDRLLICWYQHGNDVPVYL